jgi:hypothetical protein
MVTKHFALLPATGFVLILLSGLALVNWGTILQPPVARAQPPVTAMDETTRLAQVGRQRGAAPSSGADQDWRAYGSQDFAITPGSGSGLGANLEHRQRTHRRACRSLDVPRRWLWIGVECWV